MAASAGAPSFGSTGLARKHAAFVRVTHWITTLCFVALLVSGVEIVLSHPRFYWGETGNVNTTPLFKIPVPSSRRTVPTGYGYVLHDQNGWSRSLHFEAAWLVVFTGFVYVGAGLVKGHFRRNLVPARGDFSRAGVAAVMAHDEASYNVLQRITYLKVIFVLFPLVVWTGLAMSPGVVSVMPAMVTMLGGTQSARTIHFIVSVSLVAFVVVHLTMVCIAGFRRRVGRMV